MPLPNATTLTGFDIMVYVVWTVIWTTLCVLYYFFAPDHRVGCGIFRWAPSRYEQWKHVPTPEEIEQVRQNQERWLSAFNELKEKGCIDKDRKLDELIPKIKP
jgi:hypothetical protein